MLGLDKATIRKLSRIHSMKKVRFESTLYEMFHENTKFTPLKGRYYGALSAAFLSSKVCQRLAAMPFKQYSMMDKEELPPVETAGQLDQVVTERRSVRRFSGEPATLSELAKLLHFTYGKTDPRGYFRPIASGGGLYPLEIYITALNVEGLEPGLYHYNAEDHSLDAIRRGEVDLEEMERLVWLKDIEDMEKASMILFVAAMLPRSTLKYGDRGYRLVLMEAGGAVHNLGLLARSMGLGCCPMGGFLDNALSEYLGIDGIDEVPLVPMVFGRPATASPGSANGDGTSDA